MSRFQRVFRCFLLLGLLLVSACSEEKLLPLGNDTVIVAFGDSLTAGVGASEGEAYPSQLQSLTGFTVINAGISGETTEQGLARFSEVLDTHQPELVILLEGGNDILRNYDLTQTKSNLSAMIALLKNRNIQIILLGVPEKNIFSDSADFYSELATEHELVFDGKIISSLLKTRKYKSDPIHLNAQGYRKLAERLQQILQEEGAL